MSAFALSHRVGKTWLTIDYDKMDSQDVDLVLNQDKLKTQASKTPSLLERGRGHRWPE